MRFLIATARLGVIALVTSLLFGQAPGGGPPDRIGLPTDWTSKFVIFSNENSPPDFVLQDPRFWHQYFRRHGRLLGHGPSGFVPGLAADPNARGAGSSDSPNGNGNSKKPDPPPAPEVDWSASLNSGNVAAGMYPAKYTFDITAAPSCANDFVVFALNILGAAGQANIVGFNNLYTNTGGTGSCPGSAPTVRFAYRTTTAPTLTSPVLSLDGTKIAYAEDTSPPTFHVLTIGGTNNCGAGGASACNNGTVTAPVVPCTINGVTSCNTNTAADRKVTYGTAGNTRSSPFVDYANDVAYVGADDGKLYKFTSVFGGTPTLVTGGGWPVTVTASGTLVLAGPVLDFATQRIFVADGEGDLKFVRLNANCGVNAPPCLDAAFVDVIRDGALLDPPIVDSSNQKVFVFTGDNKAPTGVTRAANALQADTLLTPSSVVRVIIGKGEAQVVRPGTFDNNYFANPSTGFLYVAGKEILAGGALGDGTPYLHRIGFTGSTMNSTMYPNATNPDSFQLATGVQDAGTLTEIFNPGQSKDWLFVSVTNKCTAAITGGCIRSFDITNPLVFPSAATATRAQSGGTSGIVIDNVSAAAEASSIYFSTLAAPRNAVKLTQSGLQ